uniref:RING-type E3 ubiquitin transferase n=1 Tax=Labrus bergylta TaxID=56723 RepID=A0A3Q3G1J7_9LABR
KVCIDQDLKNILSETPGRCVPYAVIEGVVRSVKETLSSQFVDNCKGVIERLTLKEEKMVWNRTTHLWNNTEKVIHQRTNTVPFALGSHDDDIAATIRVVRPLDASLSNVIGHFISGERPKGIHETEEMLRLGDSVTGVGELVLDNNLIKLQPPKQGFQYFLTRLDYESLLRKQGNSVRLWRILTLLFGVAACSTLIFILWKRYVHHREGKKERSIRDFI